MSFAQDRRSFPSAEEGFQHCICCDRELFVLPNDRRNGYCFDCLSLLDHEDPTCPHCGTSMVVQQHNARCSTCGWSSHSCHA